MAGSRPKPRLAVAAPGLMAAAPLGCQVRSSRGGLGPYHTESSAILVARVLSHRLRRLGRLRDRAGLVLTDLCHARQSRAASILRLNPVRVSSDAGLRGFLQACRYVFGQGRHVRLFGHINVISRQ